MSAFHPVVNIEISKGYCIRKYQNKSPKDIMEELRKLSADETHWSEKIQKTISTLIKENNYDLPEDILEVHSTRIKAVNYTMDDEFKNAKQNEMFKRIRKVIDEDNNKMVEIHEVYLHSNNKYIEFDDISMAHLLLLLSKLAIKADELWLSITLQIKELGKVVFYFLPENGHIRLSIKFKSNSNINSYIEFMNDIIDGKRAIPNVNNN